ncbi:hypothetical protein [Schaalia sp. lx-100]|uniref:hypothetical protein n=1 Tax=Schaalia sp. lx-100 TaxID=2899081 RepID=UPI001E2C6110|nr:hypothetical protein [Schaalia sp. lx-100]MCD4557333.1 hypothetical protein [Schaalia sp. lx-100]
MSATHDKTSQASAYIHRVKIDANGKERIEILVPSARGVAWTPLPAKTEQPHFYEPSVLEVLLDPGQLPEWKVSILADIYREFRDAENRRKRKDSSYSDQPEPPSAAALTAAITIELETQVAQDDTAARILALIPSDKVRARVEAHVLDGATFKEIAMAENPHATEAEIKRAENSVGRSVQRALKALATKVVPDGMSGLGLR